MKNSSVINPKVIDGFVSRQTNLGNQNYDLDELYSPDTELWKSCALRLGSPKYPPQIASAPTRYWFDRSRYNNHGTITGATWQQLPSGVWVMKLDGDDYISIADHNALSFGNSVTDTPFTMLMWVKMTDATSFTLFSKVSGSAPGTREYVFLTAGADTLALILYDADDTIWIRQTDNTAITSLEGTWALLGATYNGSGTTGGIKLYVNNALRTTTATSTGVYVAMHNTTIPLEIGRFNTATPTYGNGSYGEGLIVSRVMSVGEMERYRLATRWRGQ